MQAHSSSSPGLALRLAYGAGGAVYAIKESAYTMFVLLFYTQVLGLDGSLTGAIIALSLLWDAVSDPLVGALSDRLRHRRGRRHPFMDASVLPLGLGFVGLFWPPAAIAASTALLAAWLLFWSLWVRSFITTYSIPHLALSAEITTDYQARSRILGARLAFLFLFSVLMPAAALLFIFNDSGAGDGRFRVENYPLYGGFSCLVCWLMAGVSSRGTRRFAHSSLQATGLPRVTRGGLARDFLRTLRNRSFRNLLGLDVSIMLAYGCVSTLNMLVWIYYWEFDASEISAILSLPSLLAVALVSLTLAPLGRRLEKYRLLQLSVIGLILNCLWLYPLRMLHLLPPNGHVLVFWLNLLFMLLFMYCFLMRAIQTQSIIADITDEHEWECGLRQEGGFFAASNFANKLATIFGPLYGGVVLDLIGLRSEMRPGTVAPAVLDGLAVAYGIGTLPFMIIGLLFGLRITLGRARVAQLQSLLSQRHGRRSASTGGPAATASLSTSTGAK
jgi:GPH family glycoside/pentoside/hexuronide:cation symporter